MKLKLANTLRFIGAVNHYSAMFCADLAEYLDPQIQKHYDRIMGLVQNAVRPAAKPSGEQN